MGLRLVIADNDSRTLKKIREIVTRQGYTVVGEAKDGLAALTKIRSTEPDLVILEADLPIYSGSEVAKIIEDGRIAPVIMTVARRRIDNINFLENAMVFGYLVKPVNEPNLLAALEVALVNYQKFSELEQRIGRLEETLETRNLVDKAKLILMKTLHLSEEEAFRHIQQQSMNKRVAKRAVAEAIILSHDFSE